MPRLRPLPPLHLDVRLNQNAMVFRCQQLLQRLQRRDTAGRILFAVAATEADAAEDFVVHDDWKAANEDGELALEAPLNAERLVTWKRRAIRQLIEQMRRTLVPGRGEGFVPGDLGPGYPGAVHAFERERIAALVDNADGLQHADFPGLSYRSGDHLARFL